MDFKTNNDTLFDGGIALMACTNGNDNDNASNGTDNILINEGSWRVTHFWDKDETSDFSGYTFMFHSFFPGLE